MEIRENDNGRESSKIASVAKAIRILSAFTDQEISLAAIAKATGYPKTTVHGILSTLVDYNLVAHSESSQNYVLGTGLMELAYHAKLSLTLVQIAAPVMNHISRQSNQNVYLTTHSSGRLLYLEACYRDKAYIGYSESGKTLPMHCTASGKAMLAYMTDEQVSAIVERYPLTRRTGNTIADVSLLNRELEETRKRGFAVDDEEETIGVKCVAVPVLQEQGIPVGALSLSGSAASMTMAKMYEYYELLSDQVRVLKTNAKLFPCRFLK